MIQRDGYTTSLWQADAPSFNNIHSADENRSFDIAIVGGGITGLSTALLLQEAGRQCIVLEAENLCFGTTGGTTAHLNTIMDTPYSVMEKKFSKDAAKLIASAAADALTLIRSNISKYSIDCEFQDANAWVFSQDKDQDKELQEMFEATDRAGVEVEYAEQLPFPFVFTSAMKVANQAKFNPVKYVYGLADAFCRAGGVIREHCRVTDVKLDHKLDITTSNGVYKASDIIYATHIPPGVNLLHLRCAPYRSYAMAVLLEDNNYPADLAYDMLDPYHYYRSQVVNGKTYLIAGGKDHKTGTEENTDYIFTTLEATIRENFKVKEVAYKWSSQFYEPTDGLPYIGNLPGHPQHIFVATGFGGNGMTYSHVAALLLSNILLKQHDPLIELLDPNRIKPVAGFSHFITHNTGVVSNYAGKLFSADKLTDLADLAPGEARIVRYEGTKLGLYKDEQGNLHAVNPVCSHLKCEVSWNGAEHSWDCPCHGARYDCEGKVITGPADLSLEPISVASLANKA